MLYPGQDGTKIRDKIRVCLDPVKFHLRCSASPMLRGCQSTRGCRGQASRLGAKGHRRGSALAGRGGRPNQVLEIVWLAATGGTGEKDFVFLTERSVLCIDVSPGPSSFPLATELGGGGGYGDEAGRRCARSDEYVRALNEPLQRGEPAATLIP